MIMLHPSYHDLMSRVNSEVETGEAPIVNSRYSIVLATAKRARQLIDGVDSLTTSNCPKPLSVAIDELNQAKIHILGDEDEVSEEPVQEEEAAAAESGAADIVLEEEVSQIEE